MRSVFDRENTTMQKNKLRYKLLNFYSNRYLIIFVEAWERRDIFIIFFCKTSGILVVIITRRWRNHRNNIDRPIRLKKENGEGVCDYQDLFEKIN